MTTLGEVTGLTLGALRCAQGFTRQMLAEAAELAYSSIANVENGQRTPSEEAVESWLNGLNLPLSTDLVTVMYAARIALDSRVEDDIRSFMLLVCAQLKNPPADYQVEMLEEFCAKKFRLSKLTRYNPDSLQLARKPQARFPGRNMYTHAEIREHIAKAEDMLGLMTTDEDTAFLNIELARLKIEYLRYLREER